MCTVCFLRQVTSVNVFTDTKITPVNVTFVPSLNVHVIGPVGMSFSVCVCLLDVPEG